MIVGDHRWFLGCFWSMFEFGSWVPAQCQDLSHFASATLSLVDLARDQELTSLECRLDRKAVSVPWSTMVFLDVFVFFFGKIWEEMYEELDDTWMING